MLQFSFWFEQSKQAPVITRSKSLYEKKQDPGTAKGDLTLAEEHLSRWEYRCSKKCVFNDLCHMCSYTDWDTSAAVSRGTLGLIGRKMYASI